MIQTNSKSKALKSSQQALANKDKEKPKSTPRARAKKVKKAAAAAKAMSKSNIATNTSVSPQDISSATTPSTPLKGFSKVVNNETVSYIVSSNGNKVKIYSGSCTALAIAERNRVFEEALQQIPVHPSYSIARFAGLA